MALSFSIFFINREAYIIVLFGVTIKLGKICNKIEIDVGLFLQYQQFIICNTQIDAHMDGCRASNVSSLCKYSIYTHLNPSCSHRLGVNILT